MTSESVLQRLAQVGVVPVIAIESADAAVGLADALIAGGLPVAEITFRTEAAAEVIRTLSRERPNLLVGAGTVLTVENLQRAKAAGAKFAVAPGFNPAVVRRAAELDLPFTPGVMTPSDVEGALACGCKALKFFPAGAAGGVPMLTAIAAPYRHTGVKFIPTGGIKPANLADYLACDAVLAVGGTWLATKEAIAAGDWKTIAANCREALAIAAKVRHGS
ncbi:MAG: bifunctional 4-hydroxy-2-oxoglutarate aldolase/2-dehydro-3-deoxy-phosphogluconate aldolase [Planctomycetes bacterium]|nr:bifunctional 4-hydroxy-2-oxoglutarate aldolase/2-dehydro-3-deoxy-phosphogluconate aldolase [Planctomycetota bacterium]